MEIFIIRFIMIGVLLAMFFWTLYAHNIVLPIKVLFVGIILLAIICASFFWFHLPNVLSKEEWYNCSPLKEIMLYLAMIFGMLAEKLLKAISVRSIKIRMFEKERRRGPRPKLEFDLLENLVGPLICSVVTFGTVWSQLKGKEISFISLLFCFQAGFMYETIFSELNKEN